MLSQAAREERIAIADLSPSCPREPLRAELISSLRVIEQAYTLQNQETQVIDAYQLKRLIGFMGSGSRGYGSGDAGGENLIAAFASQRRLEPLK
jgi:cystathionine beta-lyase family protein involved in aluminum resistance